ncbi:hypothetical protein F5Y18DRAFT_426712 [Xylariaceae sp. FL1019]|nr:hypothetical protein F5Y18DRAFT_426712 [Xylariaceae sp. FL1019]
MEWLDEHIKQDSLTETLLIAFIDLFRVFHEEIEDMYSLNIDDIDDQFGKWLENGDLTNRRRYLITQQDFHRLWPMKAGAEAAEDIGETSIHGRNHYTSLNNNSRGNHRYPRSRSNKGRKAGRQVAAPVHQDSDPDDVIITRETILIESSPNRTSPESEQSKVLQTIEHPPHGRHGSSYHFDAALSLTPPKRYTCKRCGNGGHWIQFCPTNLDPQFDRRPAENYECFICGEKGSHFGTLCPQNEAKHSLTKQRESAAADMGSPAKALQDYALRITSLRGRQESHPPRANAISYERTDTPRHQDENWNGKSESNLDISPYTSRDRMSRDTRLERQHYSPPRERRSQSPFTGRDRGPSRTRSRYKRRRGLQNLDNTTREISEGRLAYDDDIELMDAGIPTHIPDFGYQRMSSYPPSVEVSHEKMEEDTDSFLHTLATELISKKSQKGSGRVLLCRPEPSVDDASTAPDNKSKCAAEQSTLHVPYRPESKGDSEPQSHPVLATLFKNRDNPIINKRSERMTADDMMNRCKETITDMMADSLDVQTRSRSNVQSSALKVTMSKVDPAFKHCVSNVAFCFLLLLPERVEVMADFIYRNA